MSIYMSIHQHENERFIVDARQLTTRNNEFSVEIRLTSDETQVTEKVTLFLSNLESLKSFRNQVVRDVCALEDAFLEREKEKEKEKEKAKITAEID